jgi:cardiolipin synthase (CMP-forming)
VASIVEGRTGLGALFGLYADSFARLRASRHLRLSLLFWTGLGLVVTEAFTVGVMRVYSGRGAIVAGLVAVGWWLLVSAVLAGGAPLLRLPDASLIDYYGVPNGLSALRAYLCLPLILCATLPLPDDVGLILWLSIGAPVGLLDAVDGYIARRVGPITQLGRAIDPGGDSIFFAMAAVGNWHLGICPGWLAALILVRYLGPLLGTPIVFLARRRPDLVYTEWGRRNTLATGFVLFVLMWFRLFGGPLSAVALGFGVPLLGTTTLLHFYSLARRAFEAPVVRDRRRGVRAP